MAFLMVMARTASAQTAQGEIIGTAYDAQGAYVPGVAVSLRNTGTGLARADTSADNGTFRFPALPAGVYDLHATFADNAESIFRQLHDQP